MPATPAQLASLTRFIPLFFHCARARRAAGVLDSISSVVSLCRAPRAAGVLHPGDSAGFSPNLTRFRSLFRCARAPRAAGVLHPGAHIRAVAPELFQAAQRFEGRPLLLSAPPPWLPAAGAALAMACARASGPSRACRLIFERQSEGLSRTCRAYEGPIEFWFF